MTDKKKTAPRIQESTATFIQDRFKTLNSGLEYVADAFPVLYKRAMAELKGSFTRSQLSLIIDVFNATALTPSMAGQHIAISVSDGIALDGLDKKWDVNADEINNQIAALTHFQAACLEIWANGFWYGSGSPEDETGNLDLDAHVDELAANESQNGQRVRRGHVLRTIRPHLTDEILDRIKSDLRDTDWYAIGDGSCSTASSAGEIRITQDKNDLEYFFVEIS